MLFSRSSLELNKLWEQQAQNISEGDAERRRAARQLAKEPGDVGAQSREHQERRRGNDPDTVMQPHVDKYHDALHHQDQMGQRYSADSHARDDIKADYDDAKQRVERTRDALHARARELGREAGEFFNQGRLRQGDHIRHLSDLYGGQHVKDPHGRGEAFQFKTREARDKFQRELEKRHKEIRPHPHDKPVSDDHPFPPDPDARDYQVSLRRNSMGHYSRY